MFTNHNEVIHNTFFDSARCVAWKAIVELGERLRWRLHNTQQDLREIKEDLEVLEEQVAKTAQEDPKEVKEELKVSKEEVVETTI